jgi:hypothetical protein
MLLLFMSTRFGKPLMLLRDRWRWARGRCPLCNRNLYSAFPYYMSDHPNCPAYKNDTGPDLSIRNKHRTSGIAKRGDVVARTIMCGSSRILLKG